MDDGGGCIDRHSRRPSTLVQTEFRRLREVGAWLRYLPTRLLLVSHWQLLGKSSCWDCRGPSPLLRLHCPPLAALGSNRSSRAWAPQATYAGTSEEAPSIAEIEEMFTSILIGPGLFDLRVIFRALHRCSPERLELMVYSILGGRQTWMTGDR